MGQVLLAKLQITQLEKMSYTLDIIMYSFLF